MQTEKTESAESRIVSFAMRKGITMVSDFVPWSQSRNKAEKHPSLNWRYTLTIGEGRPLLTTDYMAGSGHCPSYRQMDNSVMRAEMVRWECENGRPALRADWRGHWQVTPKPGAAKLQPKVADVLSSLALDSSVLDESSFEDWASSLGYDPDSRKAESIYRACLDIALKLRNGLGEQGLAELREACQDY